MLFQIDSKAKKNEGFKVVQLSDLNKFNFQIKSGN